MSEDQAKIVFKSSGAEAKANKGDKLMDITRDEGWPIAYGCEDGLCGTCVIKVNQGRDNLGEIGDEEKQTLEVMGLEPGEYRLACQCEVQGDAEIEQ